MNTYFEYTGTSKYAAPIIAIRNANSAPAEYSRVKANKWLREAAQYGAIQTLILNEKGEFVKL